MSFFFCLYWSSYSAVYRRSMATAAAAAAPPPSLADVVGAPQPVAAGKTKPWVEKWRPGTLDHVIAHEDILSTLRRLMDSNNLPHLLLYGPPGTGKTTTIHACATHLFGKNQKGNVLELNASDDRGIDVVRNEIKDFASTSASLFGFKAGGPGIKLVVLDEADQMSHDAQAAMRRVIEKYTRNVRFCIICNHVNKVIPAIQSRCTRFRFGPVKKAQMLPRLEAIAQAESVPYTVDGLSAAFKLSGGDMRRCLNMLQATVLALGELNEENVYVATGNPTPNDVRLTLEAMLNQDFVEAHSTVSQRMKQLGLSATDLVRELHLLLQRVGLPDAAKAHVYIKLADVEYNLAAGTSEAMAVAAIVGALQLVREAISRNTTVQALAAPM